MCYFGDSDWRDSSFTILTDSETEVENEESVEIDLLRDVIDVLKQQNEENPRGEMNAVIENYQDRLKELYTEQLSAERKQEVQELRTLIVSIERDGLEESLKQGEISVRSYRMYQRLITRMQRSIAKQLLSIVGFGYYLLDKSFRFFYILSYFSIVVKLLKKKKNYEMKN